MNEFIKKRTDSIEKNLDEIIKKASIANNEKVKPYKKDINNALKVIENYIISKSRIIYGGLAQNELIKLKNKNDAFYKDDNIDIPDYDVYSPTPIRDLTYLCNTLYKMGFEQVSFSEAVHANTYTLRLDRVTSAILDVHYVWRPHFDVIPKIKIGKFYYTHPDFIYIDLYKIYTDPLLSFKFRIEKVFKRTTLLEKYYPTIPKAHKILDVYPILENENKEIINNFIKTILSNKDDIIICGLFCYNFYTQQYDKKNTIKVNYLSLLTDNIYKVSDIIMNYFVQIDKKKDMIIEKYHPFFEVFGNIVHIKYKNRVLFEIIDNMNRCVPYVSIKNKDNIKLKFISFHGLLLHMYSYIFLYRYKKDHLKIDFYKNLVYNLHKTRLNYLYKNNLVGTEKSVFQELIVDCIFKTDDERLIAEEKVQRNIKKGKQPIYTYRPKSKIMDHAKLPEYIYPNTSGNLIK